MLFSSQCRYQHHQCGLRQMEIGDQSVDHLEAVTRIDKDLGPAASGFQDPVIAGCRFQGEMSEVLLL